MLKYILIYILVINLIGLYMMRSDKRKAIKGKYRIPEKSLFIVAILGGSIGTTAGMHLYRHKTRHWYFKYGMPLILVVQIIAMGCLIEVL